MQIWTKNNWCEQKTVFVNIEADKRLYAGYIFQILAAKKDGHILKETSETTDIRNCHIPGSFQSY